ncbi:BTB/POZ domain-containing protein 2-like [Folsomia candida]|uniref:BTB/POZ domain-containing protein 2-like n=1 Tax=Folsomia candida TaxID=158441 RepID=UPI00160519FA|nr:BTB/POZ domain-containing protein 2-like [Folsomia candida]
MEHAFGDIIQSTLELICRNARKVLKSEEFTNLRLDCLIEIIQQDSLKVGNEIEVFEAVYRWGLAECARRSLDPSNPENLRFCLAKPLNYIRFPLMDPEEFTLVVSSKKLLSLEESVELLTTFLVPAERRKLLPAGRFISNPRFYITDPGNGIFIGRKFTSSSRQVQTVFSRSGNPNGSETITFKSTHALILKSICVPKALFQTHGPSYVYSYTSVKACVVASSKGFASNGIPCDESDPNVLGIPLNPPIKLGTEGKLTLSFSGKLSFHQTTSNACSWTSLSLGDVFPSDGFNKVVTNYGNFLNVADFEGEIQIERPPWHGLPLNCGIIEMLEFELA